MQALGKAKLKHQFGDHIQAWAQLHMAINIESPIPKYESLALLAAHDQSPTKYLRLDQVR